LLQRKKDLLREDISDPVAASGNAVFGEDGVFFSASKRFSQQEVALMVEMTGFSLT